MKAAITSSIWAKLDQVHAKHPDMVLLHGGSTKGAEKIAACWADHHKVRQIAFKPDWAKHAKAAPFKRNDQMLNVLPIGVIIVPGTGIQDNLADKARKLGIPVYRFDPRLSKVMCFLRRAPPGAPLGATEARAARLPIACGTCGKTCGITMCWLLKFRAQASVWLTTFLLTLTLANSTF